MKIVATNVVASRPPDRRPTATLTLVPILVLSFVPGKKFCLQSFLKHVTDTVQSYQRSRHTDLQIILSLLGTGFIDPNPTDKSSKKWS